MHQQQQQHRQLLRFKHTKFKHRSNNVDDNGKNTDDRNNSNNNDNNCKLNNSNKVISCKCC